MIGITETEITQGDLDYYEKQVYHDKTNNWIREAIGLSLLEKNYYSGNIITDMNMQLHYGDIVITNIVGCSNYYVDIKHSYNNNLFVDIAYYTDDLKRNEYIQKNTNDNKGWLYHLDSCDCLLLIDNSKQFFYLIYDWQIARLRLITLANTHSFGKRIPSCIKQITTNDKYCNKYTDSFLLDLNAYDIERYLGVEIYKDKYTIID